MACRGRAAVLFEGCDFHDRCITASAGSSVELGLVRNLPGFVQRIVQAARYGTRSAFGPMRDWSYPVSSNGPICRVRDSQEMPNAMTDSGQVATP